MRHCPQTRCSDRGGQHLRLAVPAKPARPRCRHCAALGHQIPRRSLRRSTRLPHRARHRTGPAPAFYSECFRCRARPARLFPHPARHQNPAPARTALLRKRRRHCRTPGRTPQGVEGLLAGSKYIKQNKKAYPTFTPNNLIYGSLQAVAGTIPKGYQWIAGLFGVKGSITDGLNTVHHFVNSTHDPWARLMFNEASFLYCYLKFYLENKKDEALDFIKDKKLDVVNNYLFTYMASNLSLNNKKIDEAAAIIQNRNKSSEYFYTPVWDFEMGFVCLYKMQPAQAIQYFENYLSNFKGNFYVKDIYQKISWCYYLLGNTTKAEEARKNCISKGTTVSEADGQALKEAKRGKWTNTVLLKARILNDGGFNKEAIQVLQGKSTSSFKDIAEQLEFTYRVGRINDDLGNDNDAIAFYLKAIALGKNRTEYYASRAALQIGMIYENRGNKKMAIQYYEQCIDMDNHDYKNSLDQRAKSGIARCLGE